jgi:hypothetical protein
VDKAIELLFGSIYIGKGLGSSPVHLDRRGAGPLCNRGKIVQKYFCGQFYPMLTRIGSSPIQIHIQKRASVKEIHLEEVDGSQNFASITKKEY